MSSSSGAASDRESRGDQPLLQPPGKQSTLKEDSATVSRSASQGNNTLESHIVFRDPSTSESFVRSSAEQSFQNNLRQLPEEQKAIFGSIVKQKTVDQRKSTMESPRLREPKDEELQKSAQRSRRESVPLLSQSKSPLLSSQQADNQMTGNQLTTDEIVHESLMTCPVDMGEYPVEDMFGLSCGHLQCKHCIQDYLVCKITEGSVLNIPCMEHGCSELYTREDIQRLGSQDIYTKYLRFHENIIVDLNPKLRWCPQPSCLNYIEKSGKRNKPSTCICGFEMCFKCGMAWHQGRSCDTTLLDTHEQEFMDYAKGSADFTNCPKCRARAEREQGRCNHITCTRCNYQWCWLCGRKFKEDHFDNWNVFGCLGMQFLDTSRCRIISVAILQFFLIPFILILKPIRVLAKSFRNPLYFPQGWRWCCPCQQWMENAGGRNCCCTLTCCVSIYCLLFPLVCLVGLVLGILNMVILLVPALLYQLYRIIRLIFYRCPCFVK